MFSSSVVIDKVKKLRAVARSSRNQHEAHNALLLAQKLLAEHHLNDVDADAPTAGPSGEHIVHLAVDEMPSIEEWRVRLAIVVCSNLRCSNVYYSYVHRDGRPAAVQVKTVGRYSDALVAFEVLESAREACSRLADEYTDERREQSRLVDIPVSRREIADWHRSFVTGFIAGLATKFEEAKRANAGWALVLVRDNEVATEFATHTKGFRQSSFRQSMGRDRDAYGRGYVSGKMAETGPRRRLQG